MPDDQTVAIQALFGQIERLTGQLEIMQKSVEGTAAKNAELLAQNAALKNPDPNAPSPKVAGKAAAKETRDLLNSDFDAWMKKVDQSLGGKQTPAARDSGEYMTITRSEAQMHAKYRAARDAAEKAGRPLRIVDDSESGGVDQASGLAAYREAGGES